MVFLSAAGPEYVHFRNSIAKAGAVVIGVEFRNAAGVLGAHPFPAGLNDCSTALRWVDENRDELGISSLTVAGESGGGNLALATALRARRDGWIDEIAGVHAQCPFISNAWAAPTPDLPSLRENDHYFISCDLLAVLAAAYDPDGAGASDPTCWPWVATDADLTGLPPHVISVNELDPLRDEGLAHLRRLQRSGVDARGWMSAGTCHGGDLLLPAAIPEVFAATIRDIHAFAASL
jgi:acetyl esterase/lipase